MITNSQTKIKASNIFFHDTLKSEKYIFIQIVITKIARTYNQGTIPIANYSKKKCKADYIILYPWKMFQTTVLPTNIH